MEKIFMNMKFENTNVSGIEGAVIGARNPMQTYDKSDSFRTWNDITGVSFSIGENDIGLLQRLLKAAQQEANSHCKFMRQIFVGVNMTAPLYLWKELDQYRVGCTTNSQSTMHTIATTPISADMFAIDDFIVDENFSCFHYFMNNVIEYCEMLRNKYLETKDKKYWKALIQLLPESWLQKRYWTCNYQVLRQIYFERVKNIHKLSEWQEIGRWISTLPYAKELIMYDGKQT